MEDPIAKPEKSIPKRITVKSNILPPLKQASGPLWQLATLEWPANTGPPPEYQGVFHTLLEADFSFCVHFSPKYHLILWIMMLSRSQNTNKTTSKLTLGTEMMLDESKSTIKLQHYYLPTSATQTAGLNWQNLQITSDI